MATPQSTDGTIDHDLANGNALLIEPVAGAITMFQAGCVADGTTSGGTNNTLMINAAIQWARDNPSRGQTVLGSIGRFSIEEPIKLQQGVDFYATTTLSGTAGGTEFICNFSAFTIANPPVDIATGRYSPVLDWSPMIYNPQLLTQQRFGGFRFNANDKDVYGIYFNEFYYMRFGPMFVINANKAPITYAVGQFNYWSQIVFNNNKAGARFIGQDAAVIDLLDTEGNLVSGSMVDFVHDTNHSTKAGVVINAWHYEETGTDFPDTLAQVSGRAWRCSVASFGLSGTPPLRYLDFLGNEAYSFDGVNFTTVAAVGAERGAISFSTVKGAIRFKADAVGCYVKSTSQTIDVDDSTNVTNTSSGLTGAPLLPRGVEVRDSTGGKLLSFPDDSTVEFYDNATRSLQQSGADWLVENTGGRIVVESSTDIFLKALSGFVDIDAGGANAGRFNSDSTAGNTRLMVFDVDNNTLEQVSVGAADSGGAGFKLLRIPN